LARTDTQLSGFAGAAGPIDWCEGARRRLHACGVDRYAVDDGLGDLPRAIASYEHALAVWSDIAYPMCVELALTGLGAARSEAGEIVQGRLDLLFGSTRYLPHVHRHLASGYLVQGDLDAADQAARRPLEYARASGVRHEEAITQRVLGEIALVRGNVAGARELLEASRHTLADVGEAGELARTEKALRAFRWVGSFDSHKGISIRMPVPLISCRSASSLQYKLLPAPAGAITTWLALSSERSNGSSRTGV
jgi:hypothetical protein